MRTHLRTILLLFSAVCLMFGLSACGADKTSAEKHTDQQTNSSTSKTATRKSDVQQSGKQDTLVVYFSATGTTKGVAKKLAAITGADLYEITPANPYSSEDLDYNNSQSRTSAEMNTPDARPEIGGKEISLDGYSTLYLGYPIWWGEAPRIMSTFVEAYSFDGITVIPFCTSGSSGIGNSGDNLAKQAASGNWLAGERLEGSASESDLKAWIDSIPEH